LTEEGLSIEGADPAGGGRHRRLRLSGAGRSRGAMGGLAVLAALALSGFAGATHVVKPGDRLEIIARRYGSTAQAVAQANRIANPDRILIGQRLQIPETAAPGANPVGGQPQSRPAAAPASSGSPARTVAFHRVRPGENLTVIAARYGTTLGAVAMANSISNPSLIRVGQVLRVPASAPGGVEELMERYSRQFGVSAPLVKAIAWQESGWKQRVLSPVGAVGVMQVMPETGRFTGSRLLGEDLDIAQLDDNVKAGVRFLAYLLKLTDGNERMAVAGYYQGLRSVRTWGMFPETRRYVANVEALKRRFSR
jgi:soluble lytic murein transglycosylase-like protein